MNPWDRSTTKKETAIHSAAFDSDNAQGLLRGLSTASRLPKAAVSGNISCPRGLRNTLTSRIDGQGRKNMANRKSVLLSLVLTFFLGPFGMLYSTVPGSLIMLVLYVVLGILTLGWAIAVLHPIAMIWGAIAADRANR
jgi:hypothetical protein